MPTRALSLFSMVILFPLQSAAGHLPAGAQPDRHSAAPAETVRTHLYQDHLACSDAAAQRLLSWGEASACTDTYLRLKLTFLDGITQERYDRMPASDRVTANRKAYDAFRHWKKHHRAAME